MIHEAIPHPQTLPSWTAGPQGSFLQRTCSCGGGGTECEECKKDHMQRHAAAPAGVSGSAAIPPAVHETLRREGSPLDTQTRADMEPRFGHDFSRVRVHDDAQASDSARAVSVHAYTVGSDIVFQSGLYAPSGAKGRELLAHELAHVVQQNSGALMRSGIDQGPSDPLEIAADKMAQHALGSENGDRHA